MTKGKETLFAQCAMLNYLHASRTPRTVREILEHLHNNTGWGRGQLEAGPPDKGLRNVQNWLKDMRESPEFGQQIEWEEDPDNRKQFRYRSRQPLVGQRIMPIEEASVLLLAERFLDALVPADFYENSLQDLFRTARSTLGKYQRRPKHARRMVENYMRRIYIDQRGQQLAQKFVPYEVLGVISKAMLDDKCVRCRYLGRDRLLHPYALVLKSPKIYLLAVEDRRLTDSDTVTPAQYLCSRITNPRVSDKASRVPANFSAESFVRTHGMDVLMERESGLPRRAFTLLLRIYEGDKDNLLRDLEEFPLSSDQTIEKEAGTRHHILRAPGMRASFQLVAWILGRMECVEVIGPRSLREQITTKVTALNTIYSK